MKCFCAYAECIRRIAYIIMPDKTVVGVHQCIFNTLRHQGTSELHTSLIKMCNLPVNLLVAFIWLSQQYIFKNLYCPAHVIVAFYFAQYTLYFSCFFFRKRKL